MTVDTCTQPKSYWRLIGSAYTVTTQSTLGQLTAYSRAHHTLALRTFPTKTTPVFTERTFVGANCICRYNRLRFTGTWQGWQCWGTITHTARFGVTMIACRIKVILVLQIRPSWMFLSLDIIFEYWIEHVTFRLLYITFRFSTGIFYRQVTSFATVCTCVWRHGLTNSLLYVGLLFENLIWKDNGFLRLTL